ncbi:hypothetical protein [Streptomyces sp. NPDC048057]|uniref:beta strand repeat-containing protein n=1 Tax=Streptomyces sp. NPDC048057 TaxID=3155628 RepID=UPI0034014489
MARRHTTGWEILGFGEDPTPGSPEDIRTLSGTYRELGDKAGEAFNLLSGDGRIRNGKGQAMDALRERIKEVPRMLESTRNSFQRAADAYNAYAGDLEQAQDTLDRAIDVGLANEAAAKTEVPTPAADATPEQLAANDAEKGRVEQAQQEMNRAVALGKDARNLREDASRRTSVTLRDAADAAIEERSDLKKIGDFLADNPILEIIAGIIIGIVSIFVPVVGLLLGAALLAFSVIRMVTQGKIDVGELLIGILTLIPGGVLLGALGKVGAGFAKLAKLVPLLSKIGKGTGTISAAIGKILTGSTAFRKFFGPLGKGIAGLKLNPAAALAGKVVIDAGTEFALGFAAAGITALAEKKGFDAKAAAIGGAIGAAVGGGLGAFGGTAFANNIKNAFTVKGKFKSNIDKAFSTQSFGVGPDGKFAFGNLLFVDGVGFPQKTGFHGLNGKTSTDAETGAVSTTITTPEGLKTETKTDPGAQKPPKDKPAPAPVISAKTETPDGFTSETTGGTNTIESPDGDKVISDGTTTTVETPVKGGSSLSTTLTPDGFTTSGPFGEISQGPDGTTIAGPRPAPPDAPQTGAAQADPPQVNLAGNGNPGGNNAGAPNVNNPDGVDINDPDVILPAPLAPNADDPQVGNAGQTNLPQGNAPVPNAQAPDVPDVNLPQNDGEGAPAQPPAPAPPKFVLNDNGIGTADGIITVGNNGQFTTVNTDTAAINNQNNTFSVFGVPNPPNTAPPLATVDVGTGTISTDLGGNHTLTGNTNAPSTVTVDNNAVGIDALGKVTFTNADNGQVVTLPPPGSTNPVTVQDGTASAAIHLDGTATVNDTANPVVTTLNGDGFTVDTGGANGSTVQFNGAAGTLDITPGSGPRVTVDPAGNVAVGDATGTGPGTGTLGGPNGAVAFAPQGHTLSTPGPGGSSFTVKPDGSFDSGGIKKSADGFIETDSTKIAPPGPDGTVIKANGQDVTVGNDGVLTVQGDQDGQVVTVPHGEQPTAGQPVVLGDATISLDGAGGPVITVNAGQGTVLTMDNGVTTVTSGPFTTVHGTNGLTTALPGAPGPGGTVTTTPDGTTTVNQGPTALTTGPDGNTTVTNDGNPTVTVPSPGDGAPVTVATSDGSASTLSGDGAQTSVNGTPAASATVDTGPGGTTTTSQAPAGNNTTVVQTPTQTSAADADGGFTVDEVKTIDSGGATLSTGTGGDGTPTVTIGTPDGAGGLTNSTVTPGGITTPDVTITTSGTGDAQITPNPTGGGAPTTFGVGNDGSLTVDAPGGNHADVGPLGTVPADAGGGTKPGDVKITDGNGDSIATAGNTTTVAGGGFTTTFTNGDNGSTVNTVHDKSGTGHTIDPNGQVTVQKPPSGATISATHTGGSVTTPPNTGTFGFPTYAGGGNTLTNGPDGPTVTTPGTHTTFDPGSTVTHNTGPANGLDGVVTVTHGPATGSFAPGGLTELKPSGNQVDGAVIDTAGKPVGDQPGQTSISTVTGDGKGSINVPAFGGAGSIGHSGFFGGGTTVNTGNTTINKTPDGFVENAGTAGQKSGVLDGPNNPHNPAPKAQPTFTVGGTDNNGPTVEIPTKGGPSTVHGDTFDVKGAGGGSFTVSVPGGGTGAANDSVTVTDSGDLSGPGVVQPAPDAAGAPLPPKTITLSNGAVVTAGSPPTFTPPGIGTGTLAFNTNNGTATTADAANGITITQNPNGTADFQNTNGGQNATFTISNSGVSGSVTTTGDNGGSFTVSAGDSGAVKVTDGAGKSVELDPGGSFHEQHSPSHDYDANVGAPKAVNEYQDYGYEAATNVIKGTISNLVTAWYQINELGVDRQTALENAGVKIGNGLANGLANKKLENQYGFKTNGLETGFAAIPTKTIVNLNNNQDMGNLNPIPDPALTPEP